MSLILVHDSTNSKLRELECDSNGLLKVDKVDVSALATDANLTSLNGKVTACDTSSVSGVVAVSAVSGDVAITAAALPLPTGAASAANQSTANTSLATVAGCVSANVLAVSSSAAALAVTNHVIWGDASAGEGVLSNLDAYSDSIDVESYSKISIYGSTTNFSHEIDVQVSPDNSNWFELSGQYIQVNYADGQFGKIMDAPFKYIRLKTVGSGAAGAETVWAWVSGQK